jgi:hypothetical protein
MSIIGNKFSRRVILQGAGAVALVGLGNVSFGLPALAAANDKYPEEAFKQKSDADVINRSTARRRKLPTRSSSMRPRSPRTARWSRCR